MSDNLFEGVLWYVAFLFSTVCHEAAHAWSALRLGDDTAHRGGQVSLNPVPHIKREPLGMVVVPLLAWFFGGWLIGWASAPYDPQWAQNHPRRAALMALAGPAANLALLLTAVILMHVGIEWQVFDAPHSFGRDSIIVATHSGLFELLAQALSVMFSLNLLLFLFNLLPFPPLDGSSALLLVLPSRAIEGYTRFIRTPMLGMVVFLFAGRLVGSFYPQALRTAVGLFFPSHH